MKHVLEIYYDGFVEKNIDINMNTKDDEAFRRPIFMPEMTSQLIHRMKL